MREGMSVKLPPKIERAIDEMPAISPVVNKLTEMARDMETSSVDLVKIIMLDPVLSAKVIKLVNSAFYGMATQIRSLSQAVLLLGVNTVKNLAMYTAVLDKMSFQEKKIPLDSQAFWRTALHGSGKQNAGQMQDVPAQKRNVFWEGFHRPKIYIHGSRSLRSRSLRESLSGCPVVFCRDVAF